MSHSIHTYLVTAALLLSSAQLCADPGIKKGSMNFNNKRLQQAKEYYIEVLRRNPDSIETKMQLARIYRQDGRFYEIEEDLVRQVLEVAPANIDALRMQGEIHYRNERWKEARDVYKKMISLYPSDYQAHISLSVILRKLGDTEGVRLLSENMKKKYAPPPVDPSYHY